MDIVLREELLRRAAVDQDARRAIGHLLQRPTGDRDAEDEALLARLGEVDLDNTTWLEHTIGTHGWPGRSLVGEDGADAAWLLAQHADRRPDLQHRCLELLTTAPAGEVSPHHVAYLTDRVRVAQGEGQIYGTQITIIDGVVTPRPLLDPDTVDTRRASVGLGPLVDYLAQFPP